MAKTLCLVLLLIGWAGFSVQADPWRPQAAGLASWYGEEHRGKAMANGQPFNPDKLTCASWHYPLGTRLQVRHADQVVVVTVTDRGPNRRYRGRVIDLSRAAYARLADPRSGLLTVSIRRVT